MSLRNIELNICSISGDLLKFHVHFMLVEISCMDVMYILDETVNIINDCPSIEGPQVSFYQTFTGFGPLSKGIAK